MEDSRKELMNEVIRDALEQLQTLEPGTKEYDMIVNNVNVLARIQLDEKKVEYDFEEKRERRNMEKEQAQDDAIMRDQRKLEELQIRDEEIHEKELGRAEQRVDRWVRVAVAGAELIIPLFMYGLWVRRGFKFEETGSYTSKTFLNLINRFTSFGKK